MTENIQTSSQHHVVTPAPSGGRSQSLLGCRLGIMCAPHPLPRTLTQMDTESLAVLGVKPPVGLSAMRPQLCGGSELIPGSG